MVAQKTIHCAVVSVPAETTRMNLSQRSRIRPSDLLPWADPYIASLVRKLQNEVRNEVSVRAESQAEEWDPWDWQGLESDRALKL